jgi:threonine dehydratase
MDRQRTTGLTFSSIVQAAELLRGTAHVTPVTTSEQLARLVAGPVFVKCENFQRTGAFKFRGAYHALSRLKSRGTARTVVTLSSGNHGQGVALAARLLGLKAHVVMPRPLSKVKHAAVVGYGGIVWLTDDRQSADRQVEALRAQEQATYVHAFNDPDVMAGQGTIMLELLDQVESIDVLLGPVGGGGLLSGLCVAGHHVRPSMQIFACEPEGAADAGQSIRSNQIVHMSDPKTIADGLRTSLGCHTVPILREHLAGIFVVTEEEIVGAMRFAFERMKMVIEPSSAVALAPILRAEPELIGKRIGVVLTGGNVDLDTLWNSLRAA